MNIQSPQHSGTASVDLPEQTRYEQVKAWLLRHGAIRDVASEALDRLTKERHENELLALNRLGAIDDDDLRDAFCAVTGFQKARLTAALDQVATADLASVSSAFLDRHRAVILDVSAKEIHAGAVDPLDDDLVRGLRFAFARPVRISVLRARDERRLRTDRLSAKEDWKNLDLEEQGQDILEFDRDAPVARRVSKWLSEAVEMRASDIHIEPRANQLEVRFRIDGMLETVASEPVEATTAVLARLKVLADLDLGQRRVAQDGRATIVVAGRKIDLRISIVPSVSGEAAVLRVLDRGEVRLDFAKLGFSEADQSLLSAVGGWPNGLFLVTGPTGSGKTTTLYAVLEQLAGSSKKILSIEDPVEFHFNHVTQVQVAPKAGVGFANAIRSFLRQDPDIIMVGEIRDQETAQTAIEAALTGHLVIASLHAIDAEKAIPRLLDMGVEPFQLAACFNGALAQRLVRKLCPECREAHPADDAQAKLLGIEPGSRVWRKGPGCPNCDGSGYRGRISIAESFRSNTRIADAIRDRHEISALVEDRLSQPLLEDAMNKVRAGKTTLEEIERALSN